MLVVAACSAAGSTGAAHPAPSPTGATVSPAAGCAWYTPTIVKGSADGQEVIVAATGPACRTSALVRWIAQQTGRPWASTRTLAGSLIAQMTKGSSVVLIYQAGGATATMTTAGYLADDLQLHGWTPEAPGSANIPGFIQPPGGTSAPPLVTHTGPG